MTAIPVGSPVSSTTDSTGLQPETALPAARSLLLLLVLGCLLPGIIGAVVMFTYLYNESNAQLRRSTMAQTRSLVREVDDQFAQLHLLAVSLAQSRALAANDLSAFHREARELLAASQRSNSVVVSMCMGSNYSIRGGREIRLCRLMVMRSSCGKWWRRVVP
ncbi:MAG: hypothetical protein ACI802_002456 [Candidatus Paceibacteria bacterium]|jgi:hypothetical protein